MIVPPGMYARDGNYLGGSPIFPHAFIMGIYRDVQTGEPENETREPYHSII